MKTKVSYIEPLAVGLDIVCHIRDIMLKAGLKKALKPGFLG